MARSQGFGNATKGASEPALGKFMSAKRRKRKIVRNLLAPMRFHRAKFSEPLGATMPHDIDPFTKNYAKRRPLLGVTILLIEDSRFCSEAVRLMALRSGARLRRADCVKSARKHLSMYRPDLIIVDLGLPDGSGLDLIRDLAEHGSPEQAILALSGDTQDSTRQDVIAAGAHGFLAKPIESLDLFQARLVPTLTREREMPRAVSDQSPYTSDQPMELDQQALLDDLDRIRAILEQALPQGDRQQLQYCAQFVASVAQTAHDTELTQQARKFFQRMDAGAPGQNSGRNMLHMLREKLTAAHRAIPDRENVA